MRGYLNSHQGSIEQQPFLAHFCKASQFFLANENLFRLPQAGKKGKLGSSSNALSMAYKPPLLHLNSYKNNSFKRSTLLACSRFTLCP